MAFDAGTIEATLDVKRNPFNEGLKKAQQDGRNFERQKFQATLSVDADTKAARTKLDAERRREDGKTISWNVDIDGRRLNRQLDNIVENTEKTAARSGNAIGRALLNPMVLQFGLLPGIAAASATASALALTAVPAAFALIAVAANKDSHKLKDNWLNAWSQIKDETQTITAPLVPYLSGIATNVVRSFKNMEPELAAVFKTAGPLVDSLADGVLGLAEHAMPGLTVATLNSGKAIEGVDRLLVHLGDGITGFFTEISTGSADAGRGADLLGQILEKLLTSLGTLVNQFSGAWATIGPQFVSTFDTLMNVVTQFTGGGLSGFNTTLQVTLTVLNAVLHVIEPFAGALGTMGGSLLGVIAGWKLLTGGISLAAKAFDLIRPATIAARLAPLTAGLNNMGVGLGVVTGKIGANADAADKWTNKVQKFSGVVTKAASALPILGAAIIGIVEASNYFFPNADELSTKIMQGGQAAADARKKISDYADKTTLAGGAVDFFGTSLDEVNAKIKDTRANMTPLERAQTDATAAQNNLTYAIKTYGEYSPQAKGAQVLLGNATDEVARAQKRQADATKSATDRLVEQTNLMLGAVGASLNYQQAISQLADAQKAVADATKQHGASSKEAKDADLAYQQQLLAVVQAVGQKTKAEADAKGATDSEAQATKAMSDKIIEMTIAAGQAAPPALRSMINGLSDSQLAAMGVTREVDNAGNAVYRLPGGKTLTFPNDAPQARNQVNDLSAAIKAVPESHYTRFYQEVFRTVTVTDPGGILPLGDTGQRASGGWITGPGGPTEDNLLYLLSNGEFVVNAKDAGIFAKVLEYINSGQARKSLPGRADGGWAGAAQSAWGGGSGTGLQAAAREALQQLTRGGSLFEDFSFHGNSANLSQYNDQLAKMFGGGDMQSFLSGIANPPAPSAAATIGAGRPRLAGAAQTSRSGSVVNIYVTSTKADPVQVASEVNAAFAWASRGSV